jgi:hypothetical protein
MCVRCTCQGGDSDVSPTHKLAAALRRASEGGALHADSFADDRSDGSFGSDDDVAGILDGPARGGAAPVPQQRAPAAAAAAPKTWGSMGGGETDTDDE